MRIHVTANGKATSISVDDMLIDYYGALLVQDKPRYHGDAKRQYELAKRKIQAYVRGSQSLPEKDLSQYVQGLLIGLIANPELVKVLRSRGPRFAPTKGRECPELLAWAESTVKKAGLPTITSSA